MEANRKAKTLIADSQGLPVLFQLLLGKIQISATNCDSIVNNWLQLQEIQTMTTPGNRNNLGSSWVMR